MNSISKIQLITINDLIHNIYLAKRPEALENVVLNGIGALVAYDSGDFYLSSAEDESKLCAPVTQNLSMAYAKEYLDSYQTQDYARGLFTGHSSAFRESDIIPNSQMVNTAYYRKFYARYGFSYSLHLTIGFNNRFLGIMSLYRKQGPDFSYNDIELLNLLVVHLEECLYRFYAQQCAGGQRYHLTELAEQFSLTRRERLVVESLVTNASNDEISAALHITTNTLKKHVSNIYRKLQVSNRIQLINMIQPGS